MFNLFDIVNLVCIVSIFSQDVFYGLYARVFIAVIAAMFVGIIGTIPWMNYLLPFYTETFLTVVFAISINWIIELVRSLTIVRIEYESRKLGDKLFSIKNMLIMYIVKYLRAMTHVVDMKIITEQGVEKIFKNDPKMIEYYKDVESSKTSLGSVIRVDEYFNKEDTKGIKKEEPEHFSKTKPDDIVNIVINQKFTPSIIKSFEDPKGIKNIVDAKTNLIRVNDLIAALKQEQFVTMGTMFRETDVQNAYYTTYNSGLVVYFWFAVMFLMIGIDVTVFNIVRSYTAWYWFGITIVGIGIIESAVTAAMIYWISKYGDEPTNFYVDWRFILKYSLQTTVIKVAIICGYVIPLPSDMIITVVVFLLYLCCEILLVFIINPRTINMSRRDKVYMIQETQQKSTNGSLLNTGDNPYIELKDLQ